VILPFLRTVCPVSSFMSKPNKTELLNLALELCEIDENQGVCFACGAIQDCVEPDATKYQCETCLEWQVYGAEEALHILS
jgi:hypothetical protein